MIPTEFEASSSSYFCDFSYVAAPGWHVVSRSGDWARSVGGVANFDGLNDSSTVYTNVCSRLLFRGNIQVIDDPAEFINLPVGFDRIVFTINGSNYYASPEMTWNEWVNSEYNTDEFYVLNNTVYKNDSDGNVEAINNVAASDIISNSITYYTV